MPNPLISSPAPSFIHESPNQAAQCEFALLDRLFQLIIAYFHGAGNESLAMLIGCGDTDRVCFRDAAEPLLHELCANLNAAIADCHDEPTNGLDPDNATLVADYVGGLDAEAMPRQIFVTTYDDAFRRSIVAAGLRAGRRTLELRLPPWQGQVSAPEVIVHRQ